MLFLILWISLKIILAVFLFAVWFMYVFGNIPSLRRYRLTQKLPGPKSTVYFGNVLELMTVPAEDILNYLVAKFEGYERMMSIWLLGHSNLYLRDAKDVQAVMSNPDHINKGIEYFILHPWLDEGLLTSTGEKWHSRRKMLTPAFHFKILEDNMNIFNRNSKRLRDKFQFNHGEDIILEEYITLCTLDVITGTAMGIDIDAQAGGKEYVAKLKTLSRLFTYRMMRPHLFNDTMFYLSSTGRQFRKAIKYLHGFSNKVIGERKKTHLIEGVNKSEDSFLSSSGKVRKAFLDLMLEYEIKNPGTFQDKDIREEVDTFMFEGHDTTSAALVFIFFNLAKYQDIQEKVYQELQDIFEGSDRETSVNDLYKMVYLEKVIKESLRLYPSVPAISRSLDKDLILSDGIIVPAGTNLIIPIYLVHRSEKYWPEPEKFDPERFSEENSQGRHPYAYVPFSAGPRNCIGQKFAMMELKTVVSTVIRKLKIEPVTKQEDIKPALFLVLRSLVPIKCKFSVR